MTASPRPRRTRPSRPYLSVASGIAVVVAAAGLTACGGDAKELEDASDGRPFAVTATASFERTQRLANAEELRITVKNDDDRPLPDVAVTLDGLNRTIPTADNGAGRVADPRRPIWVVDAPPAGGTTAYVGTWALGRLAPGASRTFTWELTPTVAGSHRVRWRVAGAVEDAAPVRASSGATRGTLPVRVSD